ncbi:hypothetical protein ACFLW6_04910 [Chloroflexota bacterium]
MFFLSMSCHLNVLLLPIILLAPCFGNSPPDKYPAATESGENHQAAVQLLPKKENRPVFRTVS